MPERSRELHIFYRPEMVVEALQSYSPSAGKPRKVVEALLADAQFPGTVSLQSFEPVGQEDLQLVHDASYVQEVFDLTCANGFGNRDPRVPPSTLYTVGSLVAATLAREHLQGAVLSPTAGFHHAQYDRGEGFCTFNGLAVAAMKYLQVHPEATVGILDCDVHYGNGTDSILEAIPQLGAHMRHFTAGDLFHTGRRSQALGFFRWLESALLDLSANCDIVLYQAGGDMAWPDPTGGFLEPYLMRQRDDMVFAALGQKVVWNLAGGYQDLPTILRLHCGTAYASVGAPKALAPTP